MITAGDFRNGMTFEEDGNVVMETNGMMMTSITMRSLPDF